MGSVEFFQSSVELCPWKHFYNIDFRTRPKQCERFPKCPIRALSNRTSCPEPREQGLSIPGDRLTASRFLISVGSKLPYRTSRRRFSREIVECGGSSGQFAWFFFFFQSSSVCLRGDYYPWTTNNRALNDSPNKVLRVAGRYRRNVRLRWVLREIKMKKKMKKWLTGRKRPRWRISRGLGGEQLGVKSRNKTRGDGAVPVAVVAHKSLARYTNRTCFAVFPLPIIIVIIFNYRVAQCRNHSSSGGDFAARDSVPVEFYGKSALFVHCRG